jgi:hypothetical protein
MRPDAGRAVLRTVLDASRKLLHPRTFVFWSSANMVIESVS